MISSVLRSRRAVTVNIMIMRAFVRLRQVLSSHKDLTRKLEALEGQVKKHDRKFRRQDRRIRELFEAIWRLMDETSHRRIGFKGE